MPRSALMRRTSGRGAMALVELSMQAAAARLADFDGRISIAVNNSPRSCVISGEASAVEALLAEFERDRVFCRRIKVDVASHSPQMDPLAGELHDALAGLVPSPEQVAICSTVLGKLAAGSAFDAAYWAANLRRPVRFGDAVGALLDRGSTVFIELGPHPILLPSIEQVAQQRGVKPATARECAPRRAAAGASGSAAVGALFCAAATSTGGV